MEILLNEIKKKTKSNYRARIDEKNKLVKNIANYGANIGSKGKIDRQGEYHGLTVEFLNKVKPLITDNRIIKSLMYIEKSDYLMVVRILDIEEEYNKYGNNIIFYLIENWILINEINKQFLEGIKNFNLNYDKKTIPDNNSIIERLKVLRHDPINCPIKIYSLGKSKKGNPVVPEEWLGKEFNNAEQLHKEMDKLDWRKNKPSVNFCCTYSMTLLEDNNWMNREQILKSQIENNKLVIVSCLLINNKIKTQIYGYLDPYKFIKKLDNNTIYYYDNKKDLLICLSKGIFKDKTEYVKEYSVSTLVSRLQKSFRRGSASSKILFNTIEQLNNSPFYNLPDQHFVKVSGTRQLLWRSYISIIEDVCGYYHKNIYDLMDLLILSLICQINPDFQLEDKFIQQFQNTLLNVQYIKKNWPWRKGIEMPIKKFNTYGLNFENNIEHRTIDSMILALKFLPMMVGDRTMLSKCVNYIAENNYNFKNIEYHDIEYYLKLSKPEVEKDVLLSTYDMHCYPNIILTMQGCIPFIPNNNYTTYKLSNFIWNFSSKNNVRNILDNKISSEQNEVLRTLKEIQQNYLHKTNIEGINKILFEKDKVNKLIKTNNIPEEISRLGFILLFGKKIKLPRENKNKPSIEIIVAGDTIKPCKIKRYSGIGGDKYNYLEGKERFEGEKRYVDYLQKGIFIELPIPPYGYNWNLKKKVKISVKLKESDSKNYINKLDFFVNDIKIDPFNTKIFLENIGEYEEIELKDKFMIEIIKNAIYKTNTISGLKLNILMREVGLIRNNLRDYRVYNISNIINNINLTEVWRQLYSRMYLSNYTEVGPVDRRGAKTHNSISYKYEGVFWRLLNLLYMLYPKALILKSDYKYELNMSDPSYYNMIKVIEKNAFPNEIKYKFNNIIKIKTTLWDHQQKTSEKIFNSMISSILRKGFGDASHVGAGKTLMALSLMSKLYNYNKTKSIENYRGYLVMLPNNKLYDTWKQEILKHTEGFDIIFQNADGSLTKKNILANSIVISTMGRTREHPLSNPWILVIIDECLTVQNKEALQTEEAFRQSIASQYNCILMSATFFRTRFDKLFFMLKILRTGIPEKIEYLDTILSESIICNLTESGRKWITNITKFELSKKLYLEYNELIKKHSSDTFERIYVILNKFISDKCNYVDYFKEKIIQLENTRKDCKVLIYTKSKEEADKLTSNNIGRYPDIDKRHVVLSYTEGTYGLNNLVSYNTILSRPPNPDSLPQMKGRLDRTGQNNDTLYIEYILVKNTIEEALLTRLEMASNFYNSYIMPLADFYEMAVKVKNF